MPTSLLCVPSLILLWLSWAIGRGQLPHRYLGSPLILQLDTSSQVNQAIQSHSQFHQNSRAHHKHFHITWEQAHQIVKSCSNFAPHLSVPSERVNPHGFHPLTLWQMDDTHLPPFGQQRYVHGCYWYLLWFCFCLSKIRRSNTPVIDHYLTTFAVLGKPLHIKTDNGQSYTSTAFNVFCSSYKFFIPQAYPKDKL
jgi:hypothetical protein